MYKHILIPTDGSLTADKAVEAGIRFAADAKAKVTLFTAVPEYRLPTDADVRSRRVIPLWDHERMSRDKAEAILEPAARRVREAGVVCETQYAECDRPYKAIIDAAESRGCDLILMSSHGRERVAELWHGSETRGVLTHSRIPTLVYR